MSKLIIETLELVDCPAIPNGKGYKIVKTQEFSTNIDSITIDKAKTRINEIKSTLRQNQKVRILEYHNDEDSENRKPCKIIQEF